MTATQCDFDFTTKRMRASASSDVDLLIDYLLLASAKEWVPAKTITAQFGFNERKVRNLARFSGGMIVSGPGSPGYRHIQNCTMDQAREVYQRLSSQGDEMKLRSIQIRQMAHRLIS